MAATFTPSLPTDKDWVRHKIGDKADLDDAIFQDEEIEAILAEQANKWLAAAELGESLLAEETGGAVEKAVGDLRIRWSDSPQSAYTAMLKRLRETGTCKVAEASVGYKPLIRTLGVRS